MFSARSIFIKKYREFYNGNNSSIFTMGQSGEIVPQPITDVFDHTSMISSVYNRNDTRNFSNHEQTAAFDTFQYNNSDFCELVEDGVCIKQAGTYNFDIDMSLLSTGGGRTSYESWACLNNIEMEGTRRIYYLRQNKFGASTTTKITFVISTNDVISMKYKRITGNGNVKQIENGSLMRIERLMGESEDV